MQPMKSIPLYPYLIEEPNKCTAESPFLLLLIPSEPQDAFIRDVLRKTWANESLVNGIFIRRLFLLGFSPFNNTQEKIIQESSTYHDIIQQDFLDTYYNLTTKTLMAMEWVGRLCPNAIYVMKIDSDMFLNPWFLIHMVLQPERPTKQGFFTGLVVTGSMPHRNKESKWYIDSSVYSKQFYPPYCSGTGYVFSGELAGRIYNETGKFTIMPYEDVHVGICLQRIGIQPSKPAGNWFIGEREEYNRCYFAKLVSVHRYKPQELLQLWPDFLKAQESCPG
ncbi:beta-1,3-galactosyltransferase 2-like [Discoglossus pictus]